MSQARIKMFRQARANARARGDSNMVRCMDVELSRLGVRDGPLETTERDVPMETAVPDKPKRGRKPMPRCEHNVIAERCEICNAEETLAEPPIEASVGEAKLLAEGSPDESETAAEDLGADETPEGESAQAEVVETAAA